MSEKQYWIIIVNSVCRCASACAKGFALPVHIEVSCSVHLHAWIKPNELVSILALNSRHCTHTLWHIQFFSLHILFLPLTTSSWVYSSPNSNGSVHLQMLSLTMFHNIILLASKDRAWLPFDFGLREGGLKEATTKSTKCWFFFDIGPVREQNMFCFGFLPDESNRSTLLQFESCPHIH